MCHSQFEMRDAKRGMKGRMREIETSDGSSMCDNKFAHAQYGPVFFRWR